MFYLQRSRARTQWDRERRERDRCDKDQTVNKEKKEINSLTEKIVMYIQYNVLLMLSNFSDKKKIKIINYLTY